MSEIKSVKLAHLVKFGNGQDWKSVEAQDGAFPVYGSGGKFGMASDFLHDGEAVLFGRKGTIDRPIYVNEKFWTVDTMYYAIPHRDRCSGKYLYYWATTIPFKTITTNTALPSVTSMDLSQLYVPLPPLETQQRIADYLDRETAEIDAAVADLDKYVELLEKRRRRVVIRGFSDPKYNPVLQRLKFLTVSEDHRRIPIKSGDRVDMAGEFPYYGASGVIDYVNDYLWDNEKRLLLSEDGANLVMRNHPVAFVADGQYWVNNHAHVLKCRGETPPELVAKAIEVTSIAHLITGSAQPKLTAAAMGEIEFLFPLSVPDQKALLADLQPEMEEIDALIEESTKLRNLLLKRRSVLITEVVTGRKQV